jgi:hypothetical protein
MEEFSLDILLNLSIIIPALAGIYVFKSINKAYRYFIISIFAAALHEYNAEFQFVPYFISDIV